MSIRTTTTLLVAVLASLAVTAFAVNAKVGGPTANSGVVIAIMMLVVIVAYMLAPIVHRRLSATGDNGSE